MTVPLTSMPGWQGGDGNSAYLDKTLRYGPMETHFDESVDWRSIRELWFRAALCSLVPLVVFAGVGELIGVSGAGLGGMACVAVFWLVFLRSKTEVPIAEWRVVLADRAAASQSVYSAIRGQLAERRLPIQSVHARRTTIGRGTVNNHLILTDGHYQVYVSVFAYGTSLYLGWMMWRSRRGSALIVRFFADLFQRLDPSDLMLRTDRPRAMREVVHALCREGLHVAIEQIEVPASYGFPNGLPQVETLPGNGESAPAAPLMAQPVGPPAVPVPPHGAPRPPSRNPQPQWSPQPVGRSDNPAAWTE
jgi:hypothetical protein